MFLSKNEKRKKERNYQSEKYSVPDDLDPDKLIVKH